MSNRIEKLLMLLLTISLFSLIEAAAVSTPARMRDKKNGTAMFAREIMSRRGDCPQDERKPDGDFGSCSFGQIYGLLYVLDDNSINHDQVILIKSEAKT